MSDSEVKYNLLIGTGDGSWAPSWTGWNPDSTTAFGTAVVSCVGDGEYDDTGYPRIGLVPRKGGSVTLSFWCRASQECEVVSHLFADMENSGNAQKHADDGTDRGDGFVVARVGTEWTYVRHTWTYDEDPWRDPSIIVARLMRVPVGVTVSIAGVMLVEGDTPAAWALAEGEELAGGGALMSANLLEGVTPTLVNGTTESDGVWHNAGRTSADGHDDWLVWDLAGQSALATNQTYHVGLSVKSAAASSTYLRPTIGYEDAAGHKNWAVPAPLAVDTSWGRAEATIVIPSGMTPFAFCVAAYGTCPETWMAAPTLSLGSPVPLATSAHTPYATQDHLRSEYATKAALKVTSDAVTAEVTERGKLAGRVGTLESTSGTHASRLEQLAASIKSLVKGESTYTDPNGQSATSGIYSLVTQTRDSVTALFGSYTKTADLASTQAVKDAKKAGTDAQAAASAAQSTADSLATLIRADSTGITVGKSTDGGVTYPQGRTRQSSDAFEVLDDGGKTLSSFSKDKVRLGVGSSTSEIDMADGHGKIFGYLDPQIADPGDGITELRISSDKFLTLHGANEALLYATPSSTVVEHQNSTHAVINVSSEIDGHTFSSDVRLEATAVDETGSDYETKSTITMLASDGATLNGAQILTAPTVLFYNESQAFNTAISLSDSAGNYKRLKIFYKSDDEDYSSVDVYNPDGKTVVLQIARPTYAYATGAAPVMYVKSKIVKISGATIDTVRVSTYGGGENYLRMQKNLSGGYEMADKVGIIRVEGYKW